MRRAYQSPCSGTHWADQWAQMPNLASANQAGARYCLRESHVASNGPGAIVRFGGVCGGFAAVTSANPRCTRDIQIAGIIPASICTIDRRVSFIFVSLLPVPSRAPGLFMLSEPHHFGNVTGRLISHFSIASGGILVYSFRTDFWRRLCRLEHSARRLVFR